MTLIVSIYIYGLVIFINVLCSFVQHGLDLKLYTLGEDNFKDLGHFYHSVLEMGQALVLELMSPVL